MRNQPAILIIDDEKSIRRLLRQVLEGEGYLVHEAECGKQGLAEAASRRPDAVVLDLGLPDIEGHAVLRRLREWSAVPVLILSVRDDADEKVKALDAGADDYIQKPFDTAELLARLRAIQRRATDAAGEPMLTIGPLRIDFAARTVHAGKEEVRLTATEYALLHELARHAGKVVTQRQLLRAVWGPAAETHTEYLRVHMTHLRRKIEPPAGRKLIRTEPGIGYRLMA